MNRFVILINKLLIDATDYRTDFAYPITTVYSKEELESCLTQAQVKGFGVVLLDTGLTIEPQNMRPIPEIVTVDEWFERKDYYA